ncbi:MAG: hypothetical protein WDN00_15345 [Limisphaerales bacterium]
MTLPTEPVTLSVAQISELNQKLSSLRHDVNNKLSIIAASLEIDPPQTGGQRQVVDFAG